MSPLFHGLRAPTLTIFLILSPDKQVGVLKKKIGLMQASKVSRNSFGRLTDHTLD